MHAVIRGALQDPSARILYGGSVKPENATGLFEEDDIDGGLVGGAALDPVAFGTIVNATLRKSKGTEYQGTE